MQTMNEPATLNLRALSIAAQKFVTRHQCPDDRGYVTFFHGAPCGWRLLLDCARDFAPGVVAVPITTAGRFWVTEGGNAEMGAEKWTAVA